MSKDNTKSMVYITKNYLYAAINLAEIFDQILALDKKSATYRDDALKLIELGKHESKYIKDQFALKIIKQNERNAYQKYMQEKDPTKREQYRQEYLEIANIHRSWRTEIETQI